MGWKGCGCRLGRSGWAAKWAGLVGVDGVGKRGWGWKRRGGGGAGLGREGRGGAGGDVARVRAEGAKKTLEKISDSGVILNASGRGS